MRLTPHNSYVLIVGGGGFIGTNLIKYFLSISIDVLNISRSWLHKVPDERVQYVKAESLLPDEFSCLVENSLSVIHLAHRASPSKSITVMQDDFLSSMKITFNLIDLCSKHGKRLIYISSEGTIYGANVQVPTPETALASPSSPYGLSKLTAERYLALGGLYYDLNYCILRAGNPYGPWQMGRGQGVIASWIKSIIEKKPLQIWGDGLAVRDYIYIEDVCKCIQAAIEYEGDFRAYNVGSGEGRSLKDIISSFQRVLGVCFQVEYTIHSAYAVLGKHLRRNFGQDATWLEPIL
jgi:UDP-glucose 4-epimerase